MGNRKRQSAEKFKENKKNIFFAKLNNCPTSPRKMRLVADQVRGLGIDSALSILKFSPKEASRRPKSPQEASRGSHQAAKSPPRGP